MNRIVICVGGALALAACNKGPQVDLKNASGQQVAKAVSQSGIVSGAYVVQPGEWVSKATIQEMNFPGMPQQFQAQMNKALAAHQPDSSKQCVTPQDALKPKENFFAAHDNSCKFAHFAMGHGKMDVQLICQEAGGTRTSNMSGTYTSTSYSMNVSSTTTGGGESGAVIKMHVDSHRIGDCSGKGS